MDLRAMGAEDVPGDDPWSMTRVVKTLWPPARGTIKLQQRFGAVLVCVRYRRDAAGRHRYTTVELVVDHAPLRWRRATRGKNGMEVVEIKPREWNDPMHDVLEEMGATWDKRTRSWTLPKPLAAHLRPRSRSRPKP